MCDYSLTRSSIAHLHATATAACRFFDRRLSPITRAFGSPKMPRTVGSGRKPGKQYESQSRRYCLAVLAIHLGCQIAGPGCNPKSLGNAQLSRAFRP